MNQRFHFRLIGFQYELRPSVKVVLLRILRTGCWHNYSTSRWGTQKNWDKHHWAKSKQPKRMLSWKYDCGILELLKHCFTANFIRREHDNEFYGIIKKTFCTTYEAILPETLRKPAAHNLITSLLSVSRFKILGFTAVTMKNVVFWNFTPYGYCKKRCFGGRYRLNHEDTRIGKLRTTLAVISNRSMLRKIFTGYHPSRRHPSDCLQNVRTSTSHYVMGHHSFTFNQDQY
jgi:hypothetical protein